MNFILHMKSCIPFVSDESWTKYQVNNPAVLVPAIRAIAQANPNYKCWFEDSSGEIFAYGYVNTYKSKSYYDGNMAMYKAG